MASWLATGPSRIVCLTEQCVDDADRQQQVKGDAGHVGPEVADTCTIGPRTIGAGRLAPREAPKQRECNRDAGGGRQEVMNRQPEHVAEDRQGLAGIALPVGVGGKAHCSVEREVRTLSREAARVQRQGVLQAQHGIREQQQHHLEQQHVHRVPAPAHVGVGVDPAELVKAPLDWPEDDVQRSAPALVDREQPRADRLGQRDQNCDEKDDQRPALDGHLRLLRTVRGG
jgi:hypothetical protein